MAVRVMAMGVVVMTVTTRVIRMRLVRMRGMRMRTVQMQMMSTRGAAGQLCQLVFGLCLCVIDIAFAVTAGVEMCQAFGHVKREKAGTNSPHRLSGIFHQRFGDEFMQRRGQHQPGRKTDE